MPPTGPPSGPGGYGAAARCAMLTGFFVLRRCGRPAAAHCPSCTRAVCPEHSGPDALCSECRGRLAEHAHDPSWTYGYRRTHYENSSSVYGSNTWYPDFDQHDRNAFEAGGGDYGSAPGGDDWAAASGDHTGGDEWDGSDTGGDWDSGGDGLVDS
ncbi:hypothetical protein DZF91_38355 [Actinomadura logoneensis]|uniref:Uncharacterized protein n=2 Tax=Actinomadura logoneensis TaxID=2293572 RepID=A0A372J8V0_9ACTN|nr:hypothetical protein DZF91_38355 [Actinomadura logoneensis]